MKKAVKLLFSIGALVFLSSCASQEKVKVMFHTTPLGVAPNIYIDGKLIGKADFNALTIYLKPGEHQVRAVKPGLEGGKRWADAEITILVLPKGKASVQSANNRGIQQAFEIHQKEKE